MEAGLRPLLCGRDAARLSAQAALLGLEYAVAPLDDATALGDAFSRVRAVLNCAGPIAGTVERVVTACLRAGAHYLDLAGEFRVFDRLRARAAIAHRAGLVLMPGVGFDVVPTDCLALHVARRLPGATSLEIAVQGVVGLSRGTALTMLEAAPQGGFVRRAGRLVQVRAAWRTRTVDLGAGPVLAVSVPLGDVSSAYYTTGIASITTYAYGPPVLGLLLRATRYLGPLLRARWVRQAADSALRLVETGPREAARRHAVAHVWTQVADSRGRTATSRLHAPEPYTLTVETALESVRRVAAGEVQPGFRTPAGAFGPDYVLQFPRVTREDL